MDESVRELKVFLPAKDFELSKRFYGDLGFAVTEIGPDLAYCGCGAAKFVLQRFYVKELADNLLMHLLVDNLDRWWAHVQGKRIAARYGVTPSPPELRPWGMRDFLIHDPSGVLWRIGQLSATGSAGGEERW